MNVRTVFLILFAALGPVAQAQPFEAVIAGDQSPCITITAPTIHVLQWIDPDRLDLGFTGPFSIASADGVRVFALDNDGPGFSFRVTEVFAGGGQIPFFTLPGYRGDWITQATNGRIFVLAHQGDAQFVAVLSPGGVLEAIHPLPAPGFVTAFAVGSDGCTLFYGQGGVVRRMNGCTGAALAPFVTADVNDVFPLPNGQVLAALDDQVVLYDAGGSVLRSFALATYGFTSGFEAGDVALSADQRTLWIAALPVCVEEDEGRLLRINFETGAELARDPLSLTLSRGLVIGLAAADVPLAGPTVLLFITLALATAGVLVLRRV